MTNTNDTQPGWQTLSNDRTMDHMTIADLETDAHRTARFKGFYDRGAPNMGERLALIHSELSEALEEYRARPDMVSYFYLDESGKPEGFPVELADAVIRIADLFGFLGVDMAGIIRLKMQYNATRPYRHGNKAC